MQSDRDVVESVLRGRRDAYATLVSRYERAVSAAALRIVGDRHAAQDVAQDAFVTAFEKLAGLRKPDAFGAWLMKITRRQAMRHVRQRRRTARLNGQEKQVEDAGAQPASNGRLDDETRRLLDAVAALPKQEQAVVTLRYFGDHSVQDVADILGRPIGTVTKQLSRAHTRLRDTLKQEHES